VLRSLAEPRQLGEGRVGQGEGGLALLAQVPDGLRDTGEVPTQRRSLAVDLRDLSDDVGADLLVLLLVVQPLEDEQVARALELFDLDDGVALLAEEQLHLDVSVGPVLLAGFLVDERHEGDVL